jgi:hydrogenase maturation protein HypF
VVRGLVQGFGFRPLVYRLAVELGLTGWAKNATGWVVVEAEGSRARTDGFLRRLREDRPPSCRIDALEWSFDDPARDWSFEIRPSDTDGSRAAYLPPDLANCAACLREVFDPGDRRYRYPFATCAACGPRFNIVETLPYDRDRTTMRRFEMCPRCRAEYEDPAARRFQAEPIVCPACGPHLDLWDDRGRVVATRDDALRLAADAVRDGRIVVKGMGGFYLLCAARSETPVGDLRRRKGREEKPFAIMASDLDAVVSGAEYRPKRNDSSPPRKRRLCCSGGAGTPVSRRRSRRETRTSG